MTCQLPVEIWRLILEPHNLGTKDVKQHRVIYSNLRLVDSTFNTIAVEHLFQSLRVTATCKADFNNLINVANNLFLARQVKNYVLSVVDTGLKSSEYSDFIKLGERDYDIETLKYQNGKDVYKTVKTKEGLEALCRRVDFLSSEYITETHSVYLKSLPRLSSIQANIMDKTCLRYSHSSLLYAPGLTLGLKVVRTIFHELYRRINSSPQCAITCLVLKGLKGRHLRLTFAEYQALPVPLAKLQRIVLGISVESPEDESEEEAYDEIVSCNTVVGNLLRKAVNIKSMRVSFKFIDDGWFFEEGPWSHSESFQKLICMPVEPGAKPTATNIFHWHNLSSMTLNKVMLMEPLLSLFLTLHKSSLRSLHMAQCLLKDIDHKSSWEDIFQAFVHGTPEQTRLRTAKLECLCVGEAWNYRWHHSRVKHQKWMDVLTKNQIKQTKKGEIFATPPSPGSENDAAQYFFEYRLGDDDFLECSKCGWDAPDFI